MENYVLLQQPKTDVPVEISYYNPWFKVQTKSIIGYNEQKLKFQLVSQRFQMWPSSFSNGFTFCFFILFCSVQLSYHLKLYSSQST